MLNAAARVAAGVQVLESVRYTASKDPEIVLLVVNNVQASYRSS